MFTQYKKGLFKNKFDRTFRNKGMINIENSFDIRDSYTISKQFNNTFNNFYNQKKLKNQKEENFQNLNFKYYNRIKNIEEKNRDYNNLFDEINKYNSSIIKILSKLEIKLKKDLEIKEEKINTVSKTIENYKIIKENYKIINEIELKKDLNNKNKKIEDLENENKLKEEKLILQKNLNEELIKREKQLKQQIKELEEKYNETKDKIKIIKNNESKYKDKDFNNLEEISKGGYGTLYNAYSKKDEINICLKKIDINLMEHNYNNNLYPEKNCIKDINNEIEILKLLSFHKNSVKYFGNYQIIKEKTIVMEKCDEDLEEFLKKKNSAFNTDEIKKIFIDLNELFEIMYKNNIIHRDLKLRNFLVKYTNEQKTEFIIKLCDYGIGKFLNEKNCTFSGIKGTIETIAPEICLSKTQKYENIVDMFSLGVIFYQLAHNLKHPFIESEYDNNFIIKYYENYDSDNYDIKFGPSIKNEDFKNLIRGMLKLNPRNRITWKQYFEHPFFK